MNQSLMGQVVSLIHQSAPPFGDVALGPDTHLVDDLGFDSMGLLTLALLLEETFALDIAAYAEDYRAIESVGDIVRFIEAYASARAAAVTT
jgi:acyl carrier protein